MRICPLLVLGFGEWGLVVASDVSVVQEMVQLMHQ
jgi:hypothetical protein